MTEGLANQWSTTLSGNGGSITAAATSFNVAAALPSGLVPPFRAALGPAPAENVLVGAVSGTAWSSVTRGIETAQGAPAAATHNDGDAVQPVLTSLGIFQLGLAKSYASRAFARSQLA